MKQKTLDLSLRDYQTEYSTEIMEGFTKGKNVILAAEQGTGKTIIAINTFKNFKKILILTLRVQLKFSWERRLEEWGIPYVPVSSYGNVKLHYQAANVCILTVQRFRNHYEKNLVDVNDFDLIVIDELADAITFDFKDYRKNEFYSWIWNYKGKILGLMPTAMTPLRENSVLKQFNAILLKIPYKKIQKYVPNLERIIEVIDDPYLIDFGDMQKRKIFKICCFLQKMIKNHLNKTIEIERVGNIKKDVLERWLSKKNIHVEIRKEIINIWMAKTKEQTLLRVAFYESKNKLKNERIYQECESFKLWVNEPNKRLLKVCQILSIEKKALIIVPFKKVAEELKEALLEFDINSNIISGDIKDEFLRKNRMEDVQFGKIQVLICTQGVLDSGTDLPQINAYINFSLPRDIYREEQQAGRIRGGREYILIVSKTFEQNKSEKLIGDLDIFYAKRRVDGT